MKIKNNELKLQFINPILHQIKNNPIFSTLFLCYFIAAIIIIYLHWPGTISIYMGLASFLLTLIITLRQQSALVKIIDIGENARTTAESIKNDRISRVRTKNYFKINTRNVPSIPVIYPQKITDRPLPTVSTGDYYALLVLDRRLGKDKTELHGITNCKGSDHKIPKEERVILVCAQATNPVIDSCFSVTQIKDDNNLKTAKTELPCWFSDDYRKSGKKANDKRPPPIRKIIVKDGTVQDLIESPAEDCYIRFHEWKENKEKQEDSTNVNEILDDYCTPPQDCGILARIYAENEEDASKNNLIFVVAGIHQFGTWIVAEFLDRVLSGVDTRYDNFLLGDQEFIAVIRGEFDPQKLQVTEAMVFNNYLWQKKSKKWIRFSDTT